MKRETEIRHLDTERAAIATAGAIGKLSDLPWYVHKWNRDRRQYGRNDLLLPASVEICGKWPDREFAIAIGGTRSPTVQAFCAAAELTRQLVKSGALIISGGVPGIDLAAHLAAAEIPGGATLAVLANPAKEGLKGHEWYSEALENLILREGAFVSEYKDHCPVASSEFQTRLLERDRIISGLCDVFIALECNVDSATVDTARRALAQGKRVFGIEAGGISPRNGVYQLSNELSIPLLDLRKSNTETAASIIARAARRATTATYSRLTD